MDTQYTATALEGTPRAEEWREIFGSRTIYLVMPESLLMRFPDGEYHHAYLLDVPSLKADQRNRLVTHICQKHQLDAGLVEKHLDDNICPIVAGDDLIIATQQPLTDSWL